MGLFKEIHCAKCGEKTNLLTRTKIANDEYLCSNCAAKVPKLFKKSLSEYSVADYDFLLQYISNQEQLENKFVDTLSYHDFHVDTENKLFYVRKGIFEKPIYFELENLTFLNFEFVPEEVKEGFLNDKVKGYVKAFFVVDKPYCDFDAKIASGVKAPAQKRFLSNKYDYSNPYELDEFIEELNSVWQATN